MSIRPFLTLVWLLSGVACRHAPASSTPPPAESSPMPKSPALTAEEQQQLQDLEKQLVGAGTSGTAVGTLLEQRGDLLERAGRTGEAIASYEAASRAYAQSPEATTMPQVRADGAREKAEKLRASLKP